MGQHEEAVRAAMDRLFAGQAVHADGRLTVKNLAVEAAIPRSTLYRAEPKLLREFERRLQHAHDTAHPVRGGLAARVGRLEAKLAAAERRAAGYRDELEQERRRVRGLANQIALLDAERRKLDDQLTANGRIVSLDAHRRQTQGESDLGGCARAGCGLARNWAARRIPRNSGPRFGGPAITAAERKGGLWRSFRIVPRLQKPAFGDVPRADHVAARVRVVPRRRGRHMSKRSALTRAFRSATSPRSSAAISTSEWSRLDLRRHANSSPGWPTSSRRRAALRRGHDVNCWHRTVRSLAIEGLDQGRYFEQGAPQPPQQPPSRILRLNGGCLPVNGSVGCANRNKAVCSSREYSRPQLADSLRGQRRARLPTRFVEAV